MKYLLVPFFCLGLCLWTTIHDDLVRDRRVAWGLATIAVQIAIFVVLYWLIYRGVKQLHSRGQFKAGGKSTLAWLLAPVACVVTGFVCAVIVVK